MSRRYDEPVDVRRRDEEPAEFVWRGRHYVIRAVLAHWVETGAWWAGASGASAEGSAALALAAEGSAALALDDAERDVWRVEASRGWVHGCGVYDVVFDWASGAWTLRGVLD